MKRPIIIAIDGPSGAGKGTLGKRLAAHFDFAFLDTGLIYRALAKKCFDKDLHYTEIPTILDLAKSLSMDDLESTGLRTEHIADYASQISAHQEIRQALLEFQQRFTRRPPEGAKGAVLDGRDIGTVICPGAQIKLFITADLETRALRRFKELQEKGNDAIYESVLQDLRERDARDSQRKYAPLKPAKDAHVVDTSGLSREEVFQQVVSYCLSKHPAFLD